MSEMCQKFRKRSQIGHLLVLQAFTVEKQANLRKLSTHGATTGRGPETKPNEAKRVKANQIRDMSKKFRKRSQMDYSACYE